MRRFACGYVRALGYVGAYGEKCRVEMASHDRFENVRHLAVQLEHDAHVEDALNFSIQHVAGQPVLGNAEAHHAAGQWPGFDDLYAVAQSAQVVGCGEP